MDELIKQAESLGIKVFKSWDEERLKAEIAKVVEAGAASSGDHAVAIEPITIRNLKANPMRALGLDSYGSATFTESQFASDAVLEKRVLRGVELGLLKVETVE